MVAFKSNVLNLVYLFFLFFILDIENIKFRTKIQQSRNQALLIALAHSCNKFCLVLFEGCLYTQFILSILLYLNSLQI